MNEEGMGEMTTFRQKLEAVIFKFSVCKIDKLNFN